MIFHYFCFHQNVIISWVMKFLKYHPVFSDFSCAGVPWRRDVGIRYPGRTTSLRGDHSVCVVDIQDAASGPIPPGACVSSTPRTLLRGGSKAPACCLHRCKPFQFHFHRTDELLDLREVHELRAEQLRRVLSFHVLDVLDQELLVEGLQARLQL